MSAEYEIMPEVVEMTQREGEMSEFVTLSPHQQHYSTEVFQLEILKEDQSTSGIMKITAEADCVGALVYRSLNGFLSP